MSLLILIYYHRFRKLCWHLCAHSTRIRQKPFSKILFSIAQNVSCARLALSQVETNMEILNSENASTATIEATNSTIAAAVCGWSLFSSPPTYIHQDNWKRSSARTARRRSLKKAYKLLWTKLILLLSRGTTWIPRYWKSVNMWFI